MAREIRLTKEGYERLKGELEKWRARLEEINKILAELMESSDDFYDDSSLEDARREKLRIEMMIAQLEDVLARAKIVEGAEVRDKVEFGTHVVLQEAESGESYDVRVVSPAEVDVLDEPMRISDESPVGQAALGRKVGESFKVTTPEGEKTYIVLSILG